MIPPINTTDPRYLTELAVKVMVQNLIKDLDVFISFDHESRPHPSLLIRTDDQQEELNPGSGIYKQTVTIEYVCRPDQMTAEDFGRQWLNIRQCFYRNDLDPRPMKDLALRLTRSLPTSFFCYGAVPRAEQAIRTDEEKRLATVGMILEVHMTPV